MHNNSENVVGAQFLMSRFCGMRRTSESEEGFSHHLGVQPGAAGKAMGMGTGLQATGHSCSEDSHFNSSIPSTVPPLAQNRCPIHMWWMNYPSFDSGAPKSCGESSATNTLAERPLAALHGAWRVLEIWGAGCQAQQPEWAWVHKCGLWQCFHSPQSAVTGFVCGSLKCYWVLVMQRSGCPKEQPGSWTNQGWGLGHL